MQNHSDPAGQDQPTAASRALTGAAVGFGVLGLVPGLLLLLVLAGVSFVGIRFAWQLLQVLLS